MKDAEILDKELFEICGSQLSDILETAGINKSLDSLLPGNDRRNPLNRGQDIR